MRWSERRAYERTVRSIRVRRSRRHSAPDSAWRSARRRSTPHDRLGLHVVIAQICTENVAGLALAEHLGFERVGVLGEVGFKFGRWLDVVVCQRLV